MKTLWTLLRGLVFTTALILSLAVCAVVFGAPSANASPRPGEIELTGVFSRWNAASRTLAIQADAIMQPGGSIIVLCPPRAKTIVVPPGEATGGLAKLKPYDGRVTVTGSDSGVGKPLTARALVIQFPGASPQSMARLAATAELFYASDANNGYDAKSCIAAGADVNAQDANGETALFGAAGATGADCLNALIAAGAAVNVRSHDTVAPTPLLRAAQAISPANVKALVAAGADLSASGLTSLMRSVVSGDESGMKSQLAGEANIDELDTGSHSALFWAAIMGQSTMVADLVAAGANINVGANTLDAAAASGSVESLKTLLGAPGIRLDHDSSVFEAVLNRHAQCIPLLKAAGENVSQGDAFGVTPLMYAVRNDDLDCVKALIAAGADVNAKSGQGDSALGIAYSTGNKDMVSILKAAGER